MKTFLCLVFLLLAFTRLQAVNVISINSEIERDGTSIYLNSQLVKDGISLIRAKDFENGIKLFHKGLQQSNSDDILKKDKGYEFLELFYLLNYYESPGIARFEKEILNQLFYIFFITPEEFESKKFTNQLKKNKSDLVERVKIFTAFTTNSNSKLEALTDAYLKKDPYSLEINMLKGELYYKAKQWAESKECYTRAISSLSNSAYAYNRRAVCNQRLYRSSEAFSDYTKGLKISPENSDLHLNFAHYYVDYRNYEKALYCYQKVIEIKPEYKTVNILIGLVYYMQNKLDSALYYYDLCIAEIPDFAATYGRRGDLYNFKLKKYSLAITDYNNAIALDPNSYLYYLNRGIAYANSEMYDEALLDYKKALTLTSNTYNIDLQMGRVYKQLGDYKLAIKYLNRTLSPKRDSLSTLYARAECNYLLKTYDVATEDYLKATKLPIKLNWITQYNEEDTELFNIEMSSAIHHINNDAFNLGINHFEACLKLLDDNCKNQLTYLRLKEIVDWYKETEDVVEKKAIEDLKVLLSSFVNESSEAKRKLAFEKYLKGITQLKGKNTDMAITLFTESIKLHPDFDRVYVDLGKALIEKDMKDSALVCFNKAVMLNPESDYSRKNRGNLYRSLYEYDKAIIDHTKCVELAPTRYNYSNRGYTYYWAKSSQAAKKDFMSAVELDPKDVYSLFYLGRSYISLLEYEKAIECFNKALKINPNYRYAYHRRAICYEKKGDLDNAIKDYNKSINLYPTYYYYYYSRGKIFQSQNNIYKAIKDFNKAIDLNDKYSGSYQMLAQCHYNIGEKLVAKQILETLRAKTDTDTRFFNMKGIFYNGTEQYEKAIKVFEKLMKQDASNVAPISNIAWTYYCLGEFEKSIQYNQQVVGLNSGVYYEFMIALATLRLGELEKAHKLYAQYHKKAIKDNTYYAIEAAVEELEELIEQDVMKEEASYIIENILVY